MATTRNSRVSAKRSLARKPSKVSSQAEQDVPLTVSRPELLVAGSDGQFRLLVHDLFGFLARHETIREGHAKMIGLVGVEYTTLISIAHLSTSDDVSVKRVAEHLHFSGAFITAVVGRLVRRGLVHKEVDQDDRRRVSLSVTDKARALLAELAPVQRQVNDVEFGEFSKDEFRALCNIARQLIENSDRAVALQKYLLSQRSDD